MGRLEFQTNEPGKRLARAFALPAAASASGPAPWPAGRREGCVAWHEGEVAPLLFRGTMEAEVQMAALGRKQPV